MRVTVPFGKANRHREGFVMEISEGDVNKSLKPILTLLDDFPLISNELVRLIRWMKARYFCTFYDAVKIILPAGVWLRYRDYWRLSEGMDLAGNQFSYSQDSVEYKLLHELSLVEKADIDTLNKIGGDDTIHALNMLQTKGFVQIEKTAVRTVSDKTLQMVSLAMPIDEALQEEKICFRPLRCRRATMCGGFSFFY